MHMHEIINTQLDTFRNQYRGRGDGQKLEILETGTIRYDTEDHRKGDGWSTQAFAAHAAAFGGHVTSIDLHIDTAASVLIRLGLDEHATLERGYSVDVMAELLANGNRFDVILLDSDNDSTLILHEYMLAIRLLRRPGLILVDDVVPGSSAVLKGLRLLPWLDVHGQPYQITPRTGNGFMSGVLSTVIE